MARKKKVEEGKPRDVEVAVTDVVIRCSCGDKFIVEWDKVYMDDYFTSCGCDESSMGTWVEGKLNACVTCPCKEARSVSVEVFKRDGW